MAVNPSIAGPVEGIVGPGPGSGGGGGASVVAGTGITVSNTNPSTVSITNTTIIAGLYGSATTIPSFTVNPQGQLTFATAYPVSAQASVALTNTHILVGNSSNVATDVAMSGDATIANTGAITLATVNSGSGTVGSSTSIPVIVTNAKGLVASQTATVVVAPAATLTGATLAPNVVNSSLTSVGTISTGVWQGTIVDVTHGGTGSNLSGTGGASQVLRQSGIGSVVTVSQLSYADISGTISPSTVALTNTHILVGNVSNVAADVAMSGDATIANTGAITLATVNAGPGTVGSSTAIPVVVTNGKGLVTSQSTAVLVAPAGTLTGGTLASGVTVSSLVQVGTISTGVWNGTPAGVQYGGTGSNLSATGGTHQVLKQSSSGASITVGQLAYADISGTLTPSTNTIALTNTHILVGNASGNAADVAMNGDATIANTGAVTLATVNANTGSFGSSTAIPTFTVNAKGLITAASSTVVVAPAATLTGGTLASNITASSLTSVGVITSGTWQGTKVGLLYGGTNADLSATGGAHEFLAQASVGAAITVVQPAFTDISGNISVSQMNSGSLAGSTTFWRGDGTWVTVSGSGTVTSVALSGGTTGLTSSGGPITTSGTITLSGTLAIANGGTGAGNLNSFLLTNTTNLIAVGYTVTPFNGHTVSSGSATVVPSNGNYQYYINNGAHTLVAPVADCAVDILITNGASAGTIAFSGFTVGTATGSTLTTTNTSKFIISVRRINSTSTYSTYALQ